MRRLEVAFLSRQFQIENSLLAGAALRPRMHSHDIGQVCHRLPRSGKLSPSHIHQPEASGRPI